MTRRNIAPEIDAAMTAADKALMRQVEEAYRRGFAQGAHVALEQVEDGHPPQRLQRWAREVDRWRSALAATGTPDSFNGWRCPPELPAVVKRSRT